MSACLILLLIQGSKYLPYFRFVNQLWWPSSHDRPGLGHNSAKEPPHAKLHPFFEGPLKKESMFLLLLRFGCNVKEWINEFSASATRN